VSEARQRPVRGRTKSQLAGLFGGLAVAVALSASPVPEGLSVAGWRTAALGLCMGIWWATEALPVAATGLVPIAVFPVLGIAGVESATAPYAEPTIYLFLGGFMVALALQRWGLHRRVALTVTAAFGGSGSALVGGFMVASAVVSMWVTNTATAMMMLPIAASVVTIVGENLETPEARRNFPVAMLLGVAYGATVGGLATLVGTPPNALLAAFLAKTYSIEIGFAQWMLLGVPLTAVLLPLCWWLLTHRVYPVRFSTGGRARQHLRQLKADLGPLRTPEWRLLLVFAGLAAGWGFRPLLSKIDALSGLSDAGLAILAAIALFVIPSGEAGRRDGDASGGSGASAGLLSWPDVRDLPWGLLLLFGGGLSLASAVSDTGLAEWLGQQLLGLRLTELSVLVVTVTVLIIFLTELTSNTATAATFLPVVAAVAVEAGFAPTSLAVPAALAASCAFMLPVATPPNAVVYGSGMLTIPQMVRAGFWLNLIAIVVVSLFAVVVVPWVLG
jgi:sodium-dependent dicarboxylate transporter 2/3/5